MRHNASISFFSSSLEWHVSGLRTQLVKAIFTFDTLAMRNLHLDYIPTPDPVLGV